ncbi:HNH endonuclease [Luteipulveratus flavus]|uniref:DUF222 domain-containing protein n=1 Tax=Luteipulveratus flavus TaxID=3031728 RepID=A0ABT6C7A5_9MICO|nr:DUF222 domain-containing protein [Luteipulveratus sp. YIM 133296]MDF8264418.1 DUF222 domain-containing protein [Luteipulveratus sp. YIM 133296]
MGKTPQLGSTATAVGVAELRAFLDLLSSLGAAVADVGDADRVDQLALLEQIRAACVAAQARVMVEFADSQVAAQEALGVPVRERGRGVADQIGLACKTSPQAAARRLGRARTLLADLPATGALLATGQIGERVADAAVRQTTHLDAADRRAVDDVVAAHLPRMSAPEADQAVRRLALERDPGGAVRRADEAARERGMWMRPAADCMVKVTAMLPAVEGLTAYEALDRAARDRRRGGDPRTLDQLRADLLTERLTGRSSADGVPVEVGLVMTPEALLDDGDEPATLRGHGPMPAALARAVIAGGRGDGTDGDPRSSERAQAWVRRIFTDPVDDSVRSVDPRRRLFDGHLRRHIDVRDQVCRTPFCDAPIRHRDHVVPNAGGGETVVANGQGLCERANHAKQMPGWRARVTADRPHEVEVVTPTGHRYSSQPPPALGPGARRRPMSILRFSAGTLRDDPDVVRRQLRAAVAA